MAFANLKKLKNDKFYRYFGIKRFHFNEMLEKLIKIEKLEKTKGRKNKLSVEERLMMTLEYWKEYYIFFQMSIKYKMSPSSCFRNITWVENKLSNNKDYQFLKEKYKSKNNKKQENSNEFQFYLIDSTEIEIERPTKKTTVRIFSGKSWMYSIKFKIVYDFLIKILLIFLMIMAKCMIFKY